MSDYNLDNLKKKNPDAYNKIMQDIENLRNSNLSDSVFQEEFGFSMEQYVLWKNIIKNPS